MLLGGRAAFVDILSGYNISGSGIFGAMPNTLAHLGIQGLLTRTAIREADLKWVYLGCVLPDIPWILQRLGRVLLPPTWFFDLWLYAIVQTSLLFCCCLAGALSVWSNRPWKTFAILIFGSTLHLLLDATQTKWGNGVHLFAPFSWELINFGWYWPEEIPTLALTAFGLAFAVFMLWKVRIYYEDLQVPQGRSLTVGFLCLILYIAAPPLLFAGPEAADNQYIRTLKERDLRVGRTIEMDRRPLTRRADEWVLTTHSGEELLVHGNDNRASGIVSFKGIFIEPSTVEAVAIYKHSGRLRDLPSMLGLGLVTLIWVWAIYARCRSRGLGEETSS